MANTSKYDKIYTVTSVSHLIPIKLDLAKLNYSHWSTLFTTHCTGFDVLPFIEGTSTSEERATAEWSKADSVVRSWIFLTISGSLLERVLNAQPKTAHEAWEFLAKVFQDNKRAKTVELTAQLKALDIGNQTVEAYFRKLASLSSLLRNLGSTIEEDDLVTYAVNGLNDKFPHAVHIILHSNPFPSLETVRSMITLEEMRSNRSTHTSIDTNSTPSSPTVLLAGNTRSTPPSNNSQQVCRGYLRGYCRFGEHCRYLHHGVNRLHNRSNQGSGTTGSNHNNWATGHTSSSPNRPTGNSQAHLLKIIEAQQNLINNFNHTTQRFTPAQSHLFRPTAQHSIGPYSPQAHITQPSLLGPYSPSPNTVGPAQIGQPSPHGNVPQFGSIPPGFSGLQPQPTYGQETLIPNAFSTTTLPDYSNAGWTMDTGASTHLSSSINNLSTVFNYCIYPSVAVGDGNPIPVTNSGHSVLPNINRPLHLSNVLVTPNIVKNLISVRRFTRDNKVSVTFDEFGFSVKDYLTHRLLLRCDNTGDLYPITTPSATSPHHALITTSSIWHQRLGHPSTDVFRRLCSSN
ncbi:uncharacterized protein [Rutidosis leptorrhynchoides]|uniref:uncharacterized protein n=1 Tax=Rutidosis leptorrhynchoides TaxID=125765 RepID=UPI003A98DBC6